MNESKQFRTKAGYCHILSDCLILTRANETVGTVDYKKEERRMSRLILIYSLIACLCIYQTVTSYSEMPIFATVMGCYGLFFTVGVIRSIGCSSAAMIDRSKIKSVTFHRGVRYLTRSRFVIRFECPDGKIRNRLIMLPGSLFGDEDTVRGALEVMQNEGLIS